MDSGIPLIISPGTALDIINETKGVVGTPSVLTDGKWAWSCVLSYYVKNYNLLLDNKFVETIVTNGWKLPISESELDYSSVLLDSISL